MACLAIVAALSSLALFAGAAVGAVPKAQLGKVGSPTGGVKGGEFKSPKSIASSPAGAGGATTGDFYVSEFGNNRVQQFHKDGSFVRAFGLNVGGAGVNVCTEKESCLAGTRSAAAGGFSGPSSIAVDPDTGNVFVAERNNRRVSVFSASGVFQGAFGIAVAGAGDPGDTGVATSFEFCTVVCQAGAAAPTSEAAGGLNRPEGSASFDPLSGNLLVPDQVNLRINEFSFIENGSDEVTGATFVRAIGWDVIPGGGTGLEVCTTVTTCKKSVTGNGAGQFIATSPGALAVDSNGYIYALNLRAEGGVSTCTTVEPCGILKFNPDGTFREDWGPSSGECQVRYSDGSSAFNVEAFDLAVDPVTNNVFVAKKTGSTGARLYEFDETGSASTCVVSPASSQPALTVESTPLFRGLAVGADEQILLQNSEKEIYILGPVALPTPTMVSPVEDVACTSATLNGDVEIEAPGGPGFEAKYHFEYSTNGSDWAPVSADAVTGSAAGPHPVTDAVTGLSSNTTYLVRLVAATSSSVASDPIAFQTQACAPEVPLLFTEEVTQTSAELGAQINPEGLKATYQFEWSTEEHFAETGELDRRAPVVARQIGGGTELVVVKEGIVDLAPRTAYVYRVTSSNSKGTVAEPRLTEPPKRFETLNACGFTDGRCLELVSPADKGPVGAAGDIVTFGPELQFQAGRGGAAIEYSMAYGLPDASAGNEVAYEAQRSADGWSSRQLAAPAIISTGQGAEGLPSAALGFSADLSCGVFVSTQPLTADTPAGTIAAGKSNLFRRAADGTWTVISNLEADAFSPNQPVGAYDLVGLSQDGAEPGCSRVFFRSRSTFSSVPGLGADRLYEWSGGTLKNVGVIPGSTGFEVAETVPGAPSQSAVSSDGTQIVFMARSKVGPDFGLQAVFLRRELARGVGDVASGSATVTGAAFGSATPPVGALVNGPGIPEGTAVVSYDSGAETLTLSAAATSSHGQAPLAVFQVRDVSQSKTAVGNNGNSRHETASTDGNQVFFTARYGLAAAGSSGATSCVIGLEGKPNGAGCDLYRYSVETDTLTDLSTPGDGSNAGGAGVAGVLGASDSGDRVYFAARGQLVPGEGPSEGENLAADAYSVYLSEDGSLTGSGDLRFVGLVSESDGQAFITKATVTVSWTSRVTPDGGHLLYESRANPGTDVSGEIGAYLYDAAAESNQCVSCRPDMQPSKTPNLKSPLVSGAEASNLSAPPQTLVEAGNGSTRAFFISYDRLAVGATEERPNLYQWEDGQITFIGASAPSVKYDLRFAGASADGDDLYFTSVDRLTWQDVDSKLDVYDARVGGGFLQPSSPPAPCDPLVEGQCQGSAGGLAGVPAVPGSAAFVGPGNEQPQQKKKQKKKKKSSKKKKGKKKGKRGSGSGKGSRQAGSNRGAGR